MGVLDAGVWSGELKRRVQHFGYRYDYRARIASRDSRIGPLPGVLEQLVRRLAEEGLFGEVLRPCAGRSGAMTGPMKSRRA